MLAGIVLATALLTAQPLPPVCFEKPPVPAKIAGQVSSRDGSPVVKVDVHAVVEGSQREYRTSSDEQGRFVLTGFDAGSQIDLTFRDAVRHVAVGCSVRPTPQAPSISLDVTMDTLGAPEGDTSLGCRLGDVTATWVGGDGVQILPRPLTKSGGEESLARFALRGSDLASVSMLPDSAVLRLTPSGTNALASFTEANVGRMSLITIEGEPAVKAVVQGSISSGVVQVPEAYLRGKRLCEILARASKP